MIRASQAKTLLSRLHGTTWETACRMSLPAGAGRRASCSRHFLLKECVALGTKWIDLASRYQGAKAPDVFECTHLFEKEIVP